MPHLVPCYTWLPRILSLLCLISIENKPPSLVWVEQGAWWGCGEVITWFFGDGVSGGGGTWFLIALSLDLDSRCVCFFSECQVRKLVLPCRIIVRIKRDGAWKVPEVCRVAAQGMFVSFCHHSWAVVCARQRLQEQWMWISQFTSRPVGTTVLISATFPNTWIYLKIFFFFKSSLFFPPPWSWWNHRFNTHNKFLKNLSGAGASHRKTRCRLYSFIGNFVPIQSSLSLTSHE